MTSKKCSQVSDIQIHKYTNTQIQFGSNLKLDLTWDWFQAERPSLVVSTAAPHSPPSDASALQSFATSHPAEKLLNANCIFFMLLSFLELSPYQTSNLLPFLEMFFRTNNHQV